MKINAIALFCGSSTGNKDEYSNLAFTFGEACAQKNIHLYYGGACIGLMGAAAKGVLAHHGKITGIAPSFFSEGTVLDTSLENMLLVNNMSERKQTMEKLADAFVALPGSYGTMDEFFELLTDAQLGLHCKPVALLNAFGYYDHLIQQLYRFKEDGFLRPFHFDLLIMAKTIDELFDKLENYQNSNDAHWLDKIRK